MKKYILLFCMLFVWSTTAVGQISIEIGSRMEIANHNTVKGPPAASPQHAT